MRSKVTLVLIFLNVALFVFIFKFERGWRTDEADLETRRRVLGPESASIQSLRISGPNVTTIELERQATHWALTAPIDWPANPHAVNRILNELQFLEHETSFSVADLARNNQSLADYGLEVPQLTIEFTTSSLNEGQRHITLQIGDETKVGNRLYLLSPARDRIHVVGLSLARSLNLPLEELRTDTVFSIPVFEARNLNLQSGASSRVRIRQEGKQWNFESPIVARADKTQVELAINAFNSLRVQRFLPNDTVTSEELRIDLVGNNRRETLILGAPVAVEEGAVETRGFQAMLEGKSSRFVVTLPLPLLDTLRNAQDTLRDPHLLDFVPEALNSLTLTAPNQPPLTLQKLRTNSEGEISWQLVLRNSQQSPQLQSADTEQVDALIEILRHLAARRFVSDAPSDADLENWGFNRPEREISLTLALADEAPRNVTLQIGLSSTPEAHVYARLGNARFVYEIDPLLLENTAPEPLRYRQRLLHEFPPTARFSALKITDLKNDSVVFETNAQGEQSSPVAQLFAALRHLEAASFFQEHFSDNIFAAGTERTWRWRIDASLSLPSGQREEQSQAISLLITDRLGADLQLAGSRELDLVFAISQPFLDALWQIIYRDAESLRSEAITAQ